MARYRFNYPTAIHTGGGVNTGGSKSISRSESSSGQYREPWAQQAAQQGTNYAMNWITQPQKQLSDYLSQQPAPTQFTNIEQRGIYTNPNQTNDPIRERMNTLWADAGARADNLVRNLHMAAPFGAGAYSPAIALGAALIPGQVQAGAARNMEEARRTMLQQDEAMRLARAQAQTGVEGLRAQQQLGRSDLATRMAGFDTQRLGYLSNLLAQFTRPLTRAQSVSESRSESRVPYGGLGGAGGLNVRLGPSSFDATTPAGRLPGESPGQALSRRLSSYLDWG